MAGFNFIRQPFAFPSWIPSVQSGQIQGKGNTTLVQRKKKIKG